MGSGIFLGCQPIKLANKNELSMNNSFSLQSSCNSHCECTTRILHQFAIQKRKQHIFHHITPDAIHSMLLMGYEIFNLYK
ncbi:hypothetical protein BLOT_011644 [Blomia tropicalis]|nr:hypothetical protein BLOT_011644 [Blomia tropicalis]